MPPGFTKSLSERLDSLSNINIKEAEEGDILKPGWAYIAPGDYHMVVKTNINHQYYIELNKADPVRAHRPSVDLMFNSLSETGIKNPIGIIMTGMGNDGTEGLKKLKSKNNCYIISQSEESCVIYGMPKSVEQSGISDKVLPHTEIHKELMKLAQK
jgi:two-component system chemotaxis response regulator CheB